MGISNDETEKSSFFKLNINRPLGTLIFLYILSMGLIILSLVINLNVIFGFLLLMIIIYPLLWFNLLPSNITKIEYIDGLCKICGNTNLTRFKWLDSNNSVCSDICAIVNNRRDIIPVTLMLVVLAILFSYVIGFTEWVTILFVIISQIAFIFSILSFYFDGNELRSQLKSGHEKALDLIDGELEKNPDDTGLMAEKGMYLKKSGQIDEAIEVYYSAIT